MNLSLILEKKLKCNLRRLVFCCRSVVGRRAFRGIVGG